jgi:hypothetical protein
MKIVSLLVSILLAIIFCFVVVGLVFNLGGLWGTLGVVLGAAGLVVTWLLYPLSLDVWDALDFSEIEYWLSRVNFTLWAFVLVTGFIWFIKK